MNQEKKKKFDSDSDCDDCCFPDAGLLDGCSSSGVFLFLETSDNDLRDLCTTFFMFH